MQIDRPLPRGPGSAGLVVGWRSWRLEGRRLTSAYGGTTWNPHTELIAHCSRASHVAPDPGCRCGIDAARSIERMTDAISAFSILGCVALSGKVVESERGWRASHARPLLLFVESTLVPQVGDDLARLYGVPVHRIPSGYRDALLSSSVAPAADALRRHLVQIRARPHPATDDTTRELAVEFTSRLQDEVQRRRQEERRREEERTRQVKEERERSARDPLYGILSAAFSRPYWGVSFPDPVERRRTFDATPTLGFLPGWQHVQVGAIDRGRPLLIAYDERRWPQCSPHIEAGTTFSPSFGWSTVTLGVRIHPGGGDVGVHEFNHASLVLTVPAHAEKIELWFHKYDRGHHGWDSRYGQNYWFDVT